jgi:peptidoglycan/LPS O-acetylase OafA/YrhL
LASSRTVESKIMTPRNATPGFADSWASVQFDLLRSLAAFLVVYQHWRNLFFVDFPSITSHRIFYVIPYILATAAHGAVMVFFVLSGYFIGGTVFRAMERNQWEWRGYLLRRLVRLWTVLVPALLLCLLWDGLGIHLQHAPALYGGHVQNHMLGMDVVHDLTPRVFFGNLFFLQTIVTPVFGSNGALWSLAYEFWYYLLFPLALIAAWPRGRWMRRLLCAVLFAGIAYFVGGEILKPFPIWLAGAALFKVKPPSLPGRKGRQVRVAASLLYALIFFGSARLPGMSSLVVDYLLTVITVMFLWILLSAGELHPQGDWRVNLSRESARFSFTLYAVHTPVLVFAVSLLAGETRWYPSAGRIGAGLGILAVVLLFAYGVAFVTEFRTDAVRLRLERIFGVKPVTPLLPSNPLANESGLARQPE